MDKKEVIDALMVEIHRIIDMAPQEGEDIKLEHLDYIRQRLWAIIPDSPINMEIVEGGFDSEKIIRRLERIEALLTPLPILKTVAEMRKEAPELYAIHHTSPSS